MYLNVRTQSQIVKIPKNLEFVKKKSVFVIILIEERVQTESISNFSINA